MSKVLVTGAAGLFGAHFSRHMTSSGHDVLGIDDLSGGFLSSVDKNSEFFQINLLNSEGLASIFKKYKPDYVYHFAAYAAEGLSPFIRNFNYSNNVLCSINIVNECIKNDVQKVVFTSSMAVYGEGNPPFNEDQRPSPEDPYGIAKYAVEMDLEKAHSHFGLRYSIVRPHNVVGTYQNIWDRYRNVIGIWIRKIINNEPITVFGDGTQIRAFSDIKFYMKPLEMLSKKYDLETFNIGADKEYSIIEAANLLSEVANEFEYNPEIIHLEKRNEVHTAYCDHSKAKNLLEFKDNTDLKETMRDMFQWALSQPNREVKKMNYEIEKGIYEFWK
tara:strand:- start:96 stop:1085 length:990 start_codon:yes stop_codon:yes gene_type:complete